MRMKREKRNEEKIFTYLSNAITAAASLSGLDKLEYAGIALELIYQNLEWSGVLEPSKAQKRKTQLHACLNDALAMTKEQLTFSQKAFLDKVFPLAEETFCGAKVWNMDEWEADLQKILLRTGELEGEWHTPKEVRDISIVFMQCFQTAVSDYEELNQVILWAQADWICSRLAAMEVRIGRLEQDLEDLQSDQPSVPHLLTVSPAKTTKHGFLHRQEERDTLTRLITSGDKPVILNGLGGIGKTALARDVYHSRKDAYRHAAWINYDKNLQDSLCGQLNLYLEEKDSRQRFLKIQNFLANTSDMLLIVDNLNKTAAEDPGLRLLSSLDAHILVTSRQLEMDGFEIYSIGFLDEDSCIDIFFNYYKLDRDRRQEKEARELVRLAQNHTLLVELLAKAAYTAAYDDLAEYLKALREKEDLCPLNSLKIAAGHTLQEQTISEHLSRLFDFSSAAIEQQRILTFFSVIPDLLIPAEVKTWMDFDINALERLCRLGWIQKAGKHFQMADIIRQTIRLQKPDLADADFLKVIEHILLPCLLEMEHLPPHTYIRLRISDIYIHRVCNGTEPKRDAVIYLFAGTAHDAAGNYPAAVKYLAEAVRISKTCYKHNSIDMACFYNAFAVALAHKGEYNASLKYFLKTANIRRKNLGKWDDSVATVYTSLAAVCQTTGDYKTAASYDKQALEIRTKLRGADSPEAAESYTNTGTDYYNSGKYNEASASYRKALTIYEKSYGTKHLLTLECYKNITNVYIQTGDYASALEHIEKALEILESMEMQNHPRAATFYNSAAIVYNRINEIDKSIQYHMKAISIRERALGSRHPDLALSYQNLAVTLLIKGDCRDALDYLLKGAAVYEEKLGKVTNEKVLIYNNIGRAYAELGEPEKAFDHFHKALDMLSQISPGHTPFHVDIYCNIGKAYFDRQEYGQAGHYFSMALDVSLAQLGQDHPATAAAYNNLAALHMKLGDYDTATDDCLKAVEILAKMEKKPLQLAALLLVNMADICIAAREADMALKLLEKAEKYNRNKRIAEYIAARIQEIRV